MFKRNKLVLFDIDGVLRDYVRYGLEYVVGYHQLQEKRNLYYKENLFRGFTEWDLKSGLKPEYQNDPDALEFHSFILNQMFDSGELAYDISHTAPLWPGITSDVWNNWYEVLVNEGYGVMFCTAQYNSFTRRGTLDWVKTRNLNDDGIIFTGHKQLIKADFLIDDRPENVLSFSGRAFLLNRTWNKNLVNEEKYNRIFKVQEFIEILLNQEK